MRLVRYCNSTIEDLEVDLGTTPMDSRLPSPLQTPPVVLLRVECHDEGSRKYNKTFRGYSMVARDPNRPITRQAFDDCLSWTPTKTPFIPFTNNWTRALRRRRKLLEEGHNQIVITAVWSKGLHNVYDAYDTAKLLGYLDGNLDRRRRLENHLEEYLVYGGISADAYRTLAIFDGREEQEHVTFDLPGLRGSATVPNLFMTDIPGETAKEKLENEIYQHTGLRGNSEQLLYLIGVLIGAFDCLWTSFVVMPNGGD